MMVSAVVDVDKNLTSLEKEDVFIASTTKLARLFFDIQHRENIAATCSSESSKFIFA